MALNGVILGITAAIFNQNRLDRRYLL